MTEKLFLGIEIGGTKLQVGVGRGDGSELLALERTRVEREQGAQGILRNVQQISSELLARFEVAGIGIGFGGPVDSKNGRTRLSHHVSGWENMPLVQWCRETFGLPAVLANDCDTAALAEARFGAGRGRSSVFYVTVGTGIGGGLVVDGKLYGTQRPAVAEIGHLRPWLVWTHKLEKATTEGLQDGSPSSLKEQDVEALASGTGIETRTRRWVQQTLAEPPLEETLEQRTSEPDKSSKGETPAWGNQAETSEAAQTAHRLFEETNDLKEPEETWKQDAHELLKLCGGKLERLETRMIAEAARSGNQLARRAFTEAVEALGWAIAQTVTLLAPEVVVVGGGVSLAGERLFFAPLRQTVQHYVFHALADSFDIVPAKFADLVVVQGALTLAAERVGWKETHSS